MKNETKMERKSDRELVVTRTFNAPAHIVYEAWAKPELFKQWWTPKSFGIHMVSCEMDIRPGGSYRLVFGMSAEKAAQFGVDPSKTFEFFGKYTEIVPNTRMVWTNDEDGGGQTITTVTFEEKGGKTFVVVSDMYPSKQALDDAIASGSCEGKGETFDQLDAMLNL